MVTKRDDRNNELGSKHENMGLKAYLEKLKRKLGLGFQIRVTWRPGVVKHRNGKRLVEEVVGDNILIYTENFQEAMELVRHGFAEWTLNQHTKPYRQLINKLIALFEETQYERKEKTVEALAGLLEKQESVKGARQKSRSK